MSGSYPPNAALTTALAFHYQVLIGLDKCFSLTEGQSIWFEKDGDVSFLAQNDEQSTQFEIKNYSAPLTDHHENLWKTLKNWLSIKFDHSQYSALVLHTTQVFGAQTRLKDWNLKTAEQKLQILKDIFEERTKEQISAEKPSQIIKLQIEVMGTDETSLKAILSKSTLFTEADNAQDLEEKILNRLIGIPKNNLNSYLQGLIGFVYSQATQKNWSVKYQDFNAKCLDLTAKLCKREFTFPDFTGHKASLSEINEHSDKDFVKKIIEIEHHEMIPDAIGNWIELHNSLIEQLDEYPLYKEKTINYQKQLITQFRLAYSSAKLEEIDPIKNSKKLYNSIIIGHPLNMGNSTPPIEYKNGLIHDAMDDDSRNLKWKVEP
ncbi:hypothetical protein CHI95_21300 [Providencia rettgeri]|uniref:Adenylate cyclase n=1 Tax=Providencia rettgeri TaxID=587 RepID=A0A264VMF4_PRORE|nr:hypothetical protein [Providencia rettgeri]OZS72514.1 hypothetical protein CHI95_21300 [Providencia rettgeri]